MHKRRCDLLVQKMKHLELDSMLISSLHNIRWLTGFSGSNALVILTSSGDLCLLTDFRYQEQVKEEVTIGKVFVVTQNLSKEIPSHLQGKVIGFQSDIIPYNEAQSLIKFLPTYSTKGIEKFCEEFVAIKDDDEICCVQEAINITDKVFHKILGMISPKVTEFEIGAEISYWNKRFGADEDSFSPIVASGARGALPHARPSKNFIENNTLMVIDMGCKYKGYCSDQTRTIAIGTPTEEMKKTYQIVLDAHLLGIDNAVAGRTGKEVDAIVRNYISNHGYGDFFGHGLGHSLGLQIHENPRYSPLWELPIAENTLMTVEPGIYLPNKFGIRIEDIVIVTPKGGLSLSPTPKHLLFV